MILDLGAGAGFYTRLFLARGAREVTAVDSSPGMVEMLCAPGIIPILSDAATVSLESRFKRIVCAGLLEFVQEPEAVLANARRLASDHAWLVVLVPGSGLGGRAYRLFHRRHGIRIRLFSRDRLAELARETGWELRATVSAGPLAIAAGMQLR